MIVPGGVGNEEELGAVVPMKRVLGCETRRTRRESEEPETPGGNRSNNSPMMGTAE